MSTTATKTTSDLTVHLFSGETRTFDTPEELLDAARDAVRRCGGMIDPDSQRIIGAAWPYVQELTPTTPVDVRLMEVAGNFHSPPKVRAPTPFDEEFEDAAEEVAEAREAMEEAERHMYALAEDLDTLTGTGDIQLLGGKMKLRVSDPRTGKTRRPDPGQLRELEAKADAAAEAFTRAKDEHQKAVVARNKIDRQRTRWRAMKTT